MMVMPISAGGREHIYESEMDATGDIAASIWPREEIIRCRDCRHYVTEDDAEPWCEYLDEPHCFTPGPNGFCAWAKRMQ